jgi:hypothetical protein
MGTERPTTPQSITVEYIVTEELDGTTLAPEIIIDQTAPDRTPFDTKAQIYRPKAVSKLGLIDPDLLVGGSIGARCIPFFSLDTEAVAAPGAALDLVGIREDETLFFQKLVQLFGGPGPFYLDDGFNVAQGSDMRLGGFAAPPGEPIRVRLTILVPSSCLDIAAFRCPCPDGDGGPVRAILPVFDTDTDGFGPELTYKLQVNSQGVIVIRGEGLAGITIVDPTTDVKVGGNTGVAPTVVGVPVVTDTTVTVTLDGAGGADFDFWGITLRDGDGNAYGAPSPLKVFATE